MFWMSIEVFNGPYAAALWADTQADALVESALTAGAIDWDFKPTAWGVAFEVAFPSEAAWEAYRLSDAFQNAMATAPESQNGILIYRGRSLDGGDGKPRKNKPKSGAGANALELPVFDDPFRVLPAFYTDMPVDLRPLVSTN